MDPREQLAGLNLADHSNRGVERLRHLSRTCPCLCPHNHMSFLAQVARHRRHILRFGQEEREAGLWSGSVRLRVSDRETWSGLVDGGRVGRETW